jgi:hypothetical protein
MRKQLLGLVVGAAIPLGFSLSATADTTSYPTGQFATPDGQIVANPVDTSNLFQVPALSTNDQIGSSPLVSEPDPAGPPGSFKKTLWGYEAALGSAKLRTYMYDATGNTTITATGQNCVPTLTDGGGVTGNGRGVAFNPIDGNLWITRLTVFAGDGKIHEVVPPNVDPACHEVKTLVLSNPSGGPIQDDIGALDVDQASKHIWAAGYKPVLGAGGVLKSFFYLVNRNNGVIIDSCWIPFRGGGVGNDTLADMHLPGVFPGSGDFLLTDAGELATGPPTTVAVIDQTDCRKGQQVTPVAELPKLHGISGIDYEWNGSTTTDVFVNFYNDGGPTPTFGAHIVGPTGAGALIEDISMCGYHATFGGSGNDMCPYP